MQISQKYPRLISYIIVIVISSVLSIIYWKAVNSTVDKIDKTTIPVEQQQPLLQTPKDKIKEVPTTDEAKKEMTKEKGEPSKDVKPTLIPKTPSINEDIKQEPNVTLHLIYTERPALVLDNISNKLAREIKWAVALWNHDLPSMTDPLQIPIQTYDWIKPHESSGPLGLFNAPNVASLLKPGNKLFGSIGISCPDCSRGRSFLVFIELNKGGWFTEVPTEKSGALLVPGHFTQPEIESFYQNILAVPEQARIPILNPK